MSTHKMVIVVRKDLNMRKGKLASQASHAAQEAILIRDENNVPSLKTSPDVLAWLATLANIEGVDLSDALHAKYGQGCPGCGKMVCTCNEKP